MSSLIFSAHFFHFVNSKAIGCMMVSCVTLKSHQQKNDTHLPPSGSPPILRRDPRSRLLENGPRPASRHWRRVGHLVQCISCLLFSQCARSAANRSKEIAKNPRTTTSEKCIWPTSALVGNCQFVRPVSVDPLRLFFAGHALPPT